MASGTPMYQYEFWEMLKKNNFSVVYLYKFLVATRAIIF